MKLHFLTLVLTLIVTYQSASAAPAANATANAPLKAEDSTKGDDPKDAERLQQQTESYNVSPTFESQETKIIPPKSEYYPYRQSLTPRLGAVFTTDEDTLWTYLAGISYLWPRYASPQLEIGADVIPEYGGHLNVGVKYIFFERGYFRPFFLWGLTHEAVAKDGLATITNIDNYYARLALGFEDVLKLPKSVRLEIEGRAGLEKQLFIMSLGYSWGFN